MHNITIPPKYDAWLQSRCLKKDEFPQTGKTITEKYPTIFNPFLLCAWGWV
jgi:hypothetical protein